MPRILMLKDDRGAPDGHTLFDYKEGKEYDVSEDLALAFMSTDSAMLCDGDTEPHGEEVGMDEDVDMGEEDPEPEAVVQNNANPAKPVKSKRRR